MGFYGFYGFLWFSPAIPTVFMGFYGFHLQYRLQTLNGKSSLFEYGRSKWCLNFNALSVRFGNVKCWGISNNHKWPNSYQNLSWIEEISLLNNIISVPAKSHYKALWLGQTLERAMDVHCLDLGVHHCPPCFPFDLEPATWMFTCSLNYLRSLPSPAAAIKSMQFSQPLNF